jgi:hypothetical protein
MFRMQIAAGKGGEDAFFVSEALWGAMGVADGVGGWNEDGVDSALFSGLLPQPLPPHTFAILFPIRPTPILGRTRRAGEQIKAGLEHGWCAECCWRPRQRQPSMAGGAVRTRELAASPPSLLTSQTVLQM